jgi:hypothetical protein
MGEVVFVHIEYQTFTSTTALHRHYNNHLSKQLGFVAKVTTSSCLELQACFLMNL